MCRVRNDRVLKLCSSKPKYNGILLKCKVLTFVSCVRMCTLHLVSCFYAALFISRKFMHREYFKLKWFCSFDGNRKCEKCENRVQVLYHPLLLHNCVKQSNYICDTKKCWFFILNLWCSLTLVYVLSELTFQL